MFKKFLKDKSGGFAINAAVSMTVVLVGVGAAIDMGGASSLRSNYQDMADAAVLSAVTTRPRTQSAMQAKAQSIVNDLDKTGTPPTVTAVLSTDNKTLTVTLSGNHKSDIMKMFGKPNIPVKALAESRIDMRDPTEVVLVLDTTRSMNYGGRLPALKTAAVNFVNTIEDLSSAEIKVSVVPYGQYVNVGLAQRNKPWIDVPPDWIEYFPDVCHTHTPVTGQTNCRTEMGGGSPAQPAQPAIPPTAPTYGTCYDDGVAYSCQTSPGHPGSPAQPAQPAVPPGPITVCDPVYGPPVTTCYPVPPFHHVWNGCVGSRTANQNKIPEYNSGTQKIKGFLDLNCGAEILPPTTNLSAVRSKINGLTTFGETYTAPGMMWGWRMLDENMPFINPNTHPPGVHVRKFVVFMTDGLNTRSQNGFMHDGTSRSSADNTTEDICDGLHAAGYGVFTITFKVHDNAAKNLVRNCASKPEWYFDENNASGLHDAFYDIGLKLMSPRLTR